MKTAAALTLALLLFLPIHAHAVEKSAETNVLTDDFSAFFEALPEEVRAELGGALTAEDGYREVQNKLGISEVLADILGALTDAWPSAMKLFVRLFGWILIAGLFSQMQNVYASASLKTAFSFCSTLVFALTLTESAGALVSRADSFLKILTSVSSALAPVAAAILAASGQVTFAAVTHAALMLLFALFQNIGAVLLAPIVRVSYCLGIVGAVSGDTRVDSIAKCVRKVFTVIMAFLMLTVTFVIGVQSTLAKSADTFSMKTVKFALGNMIPLIGGALADAVSTVSASLGMIRSAAGGVCVFALLIFVLPILIQLLLHRLVLSVCGAAADMIGCTAEAKLIGEVNGTLGYILAVVSLTAVLFLFVVSLFVLVGGAV